MGSQLLPYYAKHGITPLLFLLLPLLLLAHALPLSLAQPSNDPGAKNDPYTSVKFSPPVTVTIVVLIAVFFFVGFFTICMRQYSDSDLSSTIRPTGARANRSRRGAGRGLEKEVLETFPTFVYSEVKTQKIGKGALECAVCLNEFEDDETLRLIPKCDHVFHPECIDAWLESHTTCPVCRANLVPQPGESTPQANEFHSEVDLEAQNDAAAALENQPQGWQPQPEPQVVSIDWANQTLNRNRTRGSRSGKPRRFRRSHTTGHSMVQPGEDTERFTLRLPVDVRNRILNRSNSLVVLPRETSSRRGNRTGGGEGSSRGRNIRWLDRSIKSDRWVLTKAPPFFQRASSIKAGKAAVDDPDTSSVQLVESSRPPV